MESEKTGIEYYTEIVNASLDEISKYYVGQRNNLEIIMSAIINSGHVLINDFPGIGKTFISKLISHTLGISFSRIQFTPDLLPGDITGTRVWKQNKGDFETVKGPIFANLILADEINRAPPKTQSALLEAMEEKHVTIEGETIKLEEPFIVLATENPVEFEGTYPLPEAELDRFMVKISLGYPEDVELLRRRLSWKEEDPSSEARVVLDSRILAELRKYMESDITISEEVLTYVSSFAQIRQDKRVLAGPSPRGLISLLRLSRGLAVMDGRDFVTPDDVKRAAPYALAHRLILRPEIMIERVDEASIIAEYLNKIQVPK